MSLGSSPPPFFCDICDKQLANARTYRAHLATKTHGKKESERKRCKLEKNDQHVSQQDFSDWFGERLYGDLLRPDKQDTELFDINEIKPWLGLDSADLISLVDKIFHETLQCDAKGVFVLQQFGLNQFKNLLLAAKTDKSAASFLSMKETRTKIAHSRRVPK